MIAVEHKIAKKLFKNLEEDPAKRALIEKHFQIDAILLALIRIDAEDVYNTAVAIDNATDAEEE